MFTLTEEELKPHRKIVKKCRKSLEKTLKETKKLNKVDWLWKSKKYEDILQKTNSKLEAWEDILSHQSSVFRMKVKKLLKEDIDAIKSLSEEIQRVFTKKGWLKKKLKESHSVLRAASAVFKVVSVILAFFGIEIGIILLLAQEAAAAIIPRAIAGAVIKALPGK